MRLRWWGHVIFALGYTALAAVAAVLLAVFRPRTDPLVIGLVATQIVTAGALIHETVARRAAERRIGDRLIRMRQAYEDLLDLILKTRADKKRGADAEAAPAPAPSPVSVDHAAGPVVRVQPSAAPHPAPAAAHTPPPTHPHPPPVDDGAAIAAAIRDALAENRVETFLQPIVSLPSRKHRAYEVLTRIRLRDGSVLPPDRFLGVAEREHLLPAIDALSLGRAARLIAETDRRRHGVAFFCNVSARTLADPAFLDQALAVGGNRDSLPDKLIFELTQHDLAAALAAPAGPLPELARMGFRLSVDQVDRLSVDLEQLVDTGVGFLKLNCAFFSMLDRRAAIMELRRRLTGVPIDLVVEKIETERQFHELCDLGIEYGQGFLFGEPRLSRRVS